MTPEDYLKQALGDLHFKLALAQAEVDRLTALVPKPVPAQEG